MQKFNLNRGLTLIEIVMVLAVFALVISIIYTMFINYSRNSKREDIEYQYMQELTSLEAWVRQDLRSAVAVAEDVDNIFSIKTIYLDNQNQPQVKEIVYWVDEKGNGVQRHTKNSAEVKNFDFTGLMPENDTFVFNISNPILENPDE